MRPAVVGHDVEPTPPETINHDRVRDAVKIYDGTAPRRGRGTPPMCHHETRNVVRPAGFEPATFGFGGQRSIQLSYGRARRAVSGRGDFDVASNGAPGGI